MSVADVEESIIRAKLRKCAQHAGISNRTIPESEDFSGATVPLLTGASRLAGAIAKQSKKAKSEKRKRLVPAFTNSVFVNTAGNLTSKQIDCMKGVYKSLLQTTGFGDQPQRFPMRQRPKYRVSFFMDRRREVQICFNEKSGGTEACAMKERQVSWCNYTVLNHSPTGDEISEEAALLKTSDLRLQVRTSASIPPDSPLAQSVPSNLLVRKAGRMQVDHTKLRGFLQKKLLLRTLEGEELSFNDNCAARLLYGTFLAGTDTTLVTDFVDLYVEFNPAPLLAALRGGRFLADLNAYCSGELFPMIYRLYCKLQRLLRDMR